MAFQPCCGVTHWFDETCDGQMGYSKQELISIAGMAVPISDDTAENVGQHGRRRGEGAMKNP